MKKAKKKDNPGENIGNALLGCAVLAVITVGFAVGIRKEGLGEDAIMGIVFLSFFWAAGWWQSSRLRYQSPENRR